MEKGILFDKAGKLPLEYCKSFVFANIVRSAFQDKNDSNKREVTRKEAEYYDEIMDKIISIQFF